MSDYGVWYDDGRLSFGWLSMYGGNGRLERWEASKEAAEAQAKVEDRDDPSVVHRPMPIDGDAKQRFEAVRKEALIHRAARAWKELKSLGAVDVAVWADGPTGHAFATVYLDGKVLAEGVPASVLGKPDV